MASIHVHYMIRVHNDVHPCMYAATQKCLHFRMEVSTVLTNVWLCLKYLERVRGVHTVEYLFIRMHVHVHVHVFPCVYICTYKFSTSYTYT